MEIIEKIQIRFALKEIERVGKKNRFYPHKKKKIFSPQKEEIQGLKPMVDNTAQASSVLSVPGEIYASGYYAAVWALLSATALIFSNIQICPKVALVTFIVFLYNLLVCSLSLYTYRRRNEEDFARTVNGKLKMFRYGQLVFEVALTLSVFVVLFYGESCTALITFSVIYFFVQLVVLSLLVCSAFSILFYSNSSSTTTNDAVGTDRADPERQPLRGGQQTARNAFD